MTTHARPATPASMPRSIGGAIADDLRLVGSAFVLIGAGFLTVTMLAASLAPGYDFAGGAISDLGVIPQTALLFNGLLILVGVLNAGAGLVLAAHGGGRMLAAVYLLAGSGAIGAGIMPLDRGDIHSIFALLAFVFFNLEAMLTGGAVRGPVRLLGVLAGLVGLAYAVIMVIGDAGNPAAFGAIGHGGAERLIVYPSMLWLLAAGGYLFGRAERPAG